MRRGIRCRCERIGVDGATALLHGVDAQLHSHGFMARGGQAIDATLVAAPVQHISNAERSELADGQQPAWSEARRRQKDVDATHTKKHGKGYFGYKLSVSVDYKHGFIRGVATGTASEHDGHHFEEVLDVNNTGKEVNADKAYPSAQRLAMLKTLGFKEGIQRKAQKNKPLSACQQRRNHRIAKRRAKVEYVFAGIRHMVQIQAFKDTGACSSSELMGNAGPKGPALLQIVVLNSWNAQFTPLLLRNVGL